MVENKISDFLEVLASKEPVPGGGGASSLAGAMGIALGNMVSNLTIGKKKYAEVQDEILELVEKGTVLIKRFCDLVEEDAKAFEPLSKAYGLPRETKEEQEYRDQVMEKALLEASLVPMQIMEAAMESMVILERLSVIGTRIAVSDVGVGIQLAKSALLGASMNVYINTKLMKNREKSQELNKKADQLILEGSKKADEVFEQVMKELR